MKKSNAVSRAVVPVLFVALLFVVFLGFVYLFANRIWGSASDEPPTTISQGGESVVGGVVNLEKENKAVMWRIKTVVLDDKFYSGTEEHRYECAEKLLNSLSDDGLVLEYSYQDGAFEFKRIDGMICHIIISYDNEWELTDVADTKILETYDVDGFDTFDIDVKKRRAREVLSLLIIDGLVLDYIETDTGFSFMYFNGVYGGIDFEEFDPDFNGR